MPKFNRDGISLHYEKSGKGAEAIIFIHGNFASWRWWAPQLSSLPATFTAYAPDLRGCGDSDQPESGYDMESLIDDLAGLVNHLGINNFHLVGHSLGGAIVQEYCLRFPEQIKTLTLVAPAPADGLARLKNRKQHSLLGELFAPERIFRSFSSMNLHKPMLKLALRRSMPGSEHWSEFGMLLDTATSMSTEAFSGYLHLLQEWKNRAPENIKCPVLLIHGLIDPVVPATELVPMAAQFPDCRLVSWPNVGHAPQLEQPETFSWVLYRFIETHDVPEQSELLASIKQKLAASPLSGIKSTGDKITGWLRRQFNRFNQ